MRIKLSTFVAVAALAAAVTSTASASELCAGVSNVTAIAAAGGCTVSGSDLLFNNFSVIATSGFTQAAVGIATAPFGTDVVGSDVDLSFQIGGLLGSGATSGIGDIELSYTVTGGILGLDIVEQASQVTTGGSLTVTEAACTVAWVANTCGGSVLANFSATSSGQTVTNQQIFSPAYSGTVYIEKNLLYDGATTSSLVNSHIVAAPEPATYSLIGAGLLGVGLLKRRLHK
jgi:hypothetical protein